MEGETCANCPYDCTCGTANCQDVLTCTYGCNWDEACINACAEGGCYEAQTQVVELLVCLQDNCLTQCVDMASTSCLTCAMTSCSTEAMACYNGTCGPTQCGDGVCQPNEDCTNCPGDCGQCPDLCGDGVCQLMEDCNSCEADCGPCFWCGDGYCDPNEDCAGCPEDCGQCPILCGDGICEQLLGESCANCPQDCSCGGETCAAILTCITGCQDILCPGQCLSSGCYSAQQQAHEVLSCLISNCIMSCINPSDPGCMTCLTDNCSGQLLACMMGTCP
jgi:hypothetical protein